MWRNGEKTVYVLLGVVSIPVIASDKPGQSWTLPTSSQDASQTTPISMMATHYGGVSVREGSRATRSSGTWERALGGRCYVAVPRQRKHQSTTASQEDAPITAGGGNFNITRGCFCDFDVTKDNYSTISARYRCPRDQRKSNHIKHSFNLPVSAKIDWNSPSSLPGARIPAGHCPRSTIPG